MRNIAKVASFLAFLLPIFAIHLTKPMLVFADGVYGQNGCVPVYGGGVQCPRVGQALINKTVRNPSTGIFVDNLGPSDPKFRPSWLVNFRITVQNTGDQTLNNVKVTDTLPDFVDFTSGPGSFDPNSKTLTFNVTNLTGGASRTFDVAARAVHAAVLPADKSIVCSVNTVDAMVTDTNQTDRDSSQFCIEKEMTVPSVPTAGPREWLLTVAGLASSLTAGLYLRKKAI